ncbi:MAG: flagellar hook-length control protein FliK [Pseudomonadota bacterium]
MTVSESVVPPQVTRPDGGLDSVAGPVPTMPEATRRTETSLRPAPPSGLEMSVMRQIVTGAQGRAEQVFELALEPAELGKVRIALSPSDAGVTVSIVAERPETLELLRRHADLMSQDLRAIGFSDVDLDFGATKNNSPGWPGSAEPRQTPQERPLSGDAADIQETPPTPIRRADHATASLDLRL